MLGPRNFYQSPHLYPIGYYLCISRDPLIPSFNHEVIAMSFPTSQDVLTTTVTPTLSTLQNILAFAGLLVLKASTTLLLVTLAVLFAVAVYRLYLHPLSSIPGPPLAALSNAWHAYHVRNGQMYELGQTLHKKYGPVVRVGPDELWFDSREAFKTIYSKCLSPGSIMSSSQHTLLVQLALNRRIKVMLTRLKHRCRKWI